MPSPAGDRQRATGDAFARPPRGRLAARLRLRARACSGRGIEPARRACHNSRVPTNYERAYAQRPEVLAAWMQLNGAIKAGMDLRRYELATLAAARRLRSSYCCLAHGRVLMEQYGEPVREIAVDHRAAGLDEVDVAVMDLAERVVDDATAIGDSDLQRLRDLGLTDTEIM